jgi:hypothetical protein
MSRGGNGRFTERPPGARPEFEVGNRVALKHGSRAVVALQPRAAEIADDLRRIVPAATEADEPAIRVASLVFAQVEAGHAYIAEHGWYDEDGKPRAIMQTFPTLQAEARRWCEALGLTPSARARLGLDLSRTGVALREHLERNYGEQEAKP